MMVAMELNLEDPFMLREAPKEIAIETTMAIGSKWL